MEAYELGNCIGKGNYGEVYLARHAKENKTYVVKRLNVFDIKDKERESIENEVS